LTAESAPNNNTQMLEMALDSSNLPVSYLSSILRVTQAAVREVARTTEATRQAFSQQPQPVLMASTHTSDDQLVLSFVFADPIDSTAMTELSASVFAVFMDRFAELLKGLPQRGLWGASSRGSRRRRYETDLEKRMDQLRAELRRFAHARLSFDNRSIQFDGDRLEID